MIHKLFTVYDCKAEAYLPLFHMPSVGQAVRAFGDTCNDSEHQFFRHPEDFTLFYLGEWNDAKASFNVVATPQALGVAIEYKAAAAAPVEAARAASQSNGASLASRG